MSEIVRGWLGGTGWTPETINYVAWIILGLVVIILAWLAAMATKRVLLRLVSFVIKRSRTDWDDALLRRHVFTRLSHLAPALVLYFTANLFGDAVAAIQQVALAYMMMVGLGAINGFLSAAGDIYATFSISRNRPVKGYIQLVKIIVSVFILILATATLMDRSPWLLLSGLGAMTAVLILVFKDTILGLVASVQLSSNNMIHIGDWIEMPQYGADGDVIDMTLHTVVVQNWDKTIVTLPAYSLISGSFKNWRGMSESGGRRIKRAINIDISTIKFCTPEMLQRFERFEFITEYVRSKITELEKHNDEHKVDRSELINGRHMTNIGTFRAYVEAYLRNHPMVHREMTFLVRQLPTSEHGMPLEVYVFCKDQEWSNYEAIMADIFDHLIASVALFELRLFQSPSGSDLRSLKEANESA